MRTYALASSPSAFEQWFARWPDGDGWMYLGEETTYDRRRRELVTRRCVVCYESGKRPMEAKDFPSESAARTAGEAMLPRGLEVTRWQPGT